jgi:hypothetical protein
VPDGRSASRASLSHIASATARTVPSPPAAMTTDAPASSACFVTSVPGSSTEVSNQSVSSQPAPCSSRSTAFRSASMSTFTGL